METTSKRINEDVFADARSASMYPWPTKASEMHADAIGGSPMRGIKTDALIKNEPAMNRASVSSLDPRTLSRFGSDDGSRTR